MKEGRLGTEGIWQEMLLKQAPQTPAIRPVVLPLFGALLLQSLECHLGCLHLVYKPTVSYLLNGLTKSLKSTQKKTQHIEILVDGTHVAYPLAYPSVPPLKKYCPGQSCISQEHTGNPSLRTGYAGTKCHQAPGTVQWISPRPLINGKCDQGTSQQVTTRHTPGGLSRPHISQSHLQGG